MLPYTSSFVPTALSLQSTSAGILQAPPQPTGDKGFGKGVAGEWGKGRLDNSPQDKESWQQSQDQCSAAPAFDSDALHLATFRFKHRVMGPGAHPGTRERVSRELLQLSTPVVMATGPSGPEPVIKLVHVKHLAVTSKATISTCTTGKDPSNNLSFPVIIWTG